MFENIRIPWTAKAIWTKISLKAEGTFLHFLSFLLCLFHSTCFYFSRSCSTWHLRRIRRQVLLSISQRDIGSIPDRRTDITEHTEANVRRPFSGLTGSRQRDWGWRGKRGSSSDISQFPQSTRYERSPRQISLIERVSSTSQERNSLRR